MTNKLDTNLVISGLGIISPIGQNSETFFAALMAGKSNFSMLSRPGRGMGRFMGAELVNFTPPPILLERKIRHTCLTAQVAVAAITQAWQQADLDQLASQDLGLIIGGSNLNQRQQLLHYRQYQDKLAFIRPRYAASFMDTDISAVATQTFGIHGLAYSLGGASSSGQLALIQAAHAVSSGQVRTCLALGALLDISELELQAFQSLGAMAPVDKAIKASAACRPFDQDHQGFVYGENCAVLVVETLASATSRGVTPLARIAGTGLVIDGNCSPNPSQKGEEQAMRQALNQAKWKADSIDLVNPHGTGSKLGDEIELQALQALGLSQAWINTTKSMTGHGLTAAGAVELVATVLQLQHQQLHPCLNLANPIGKMNWVTNEDNNPYKLKRALSLSLGFGGINTAVCLEKI